MVWRKIFVLLTSWAVLLGCFWTTVIAQTNGQSVLTLKQTPTISGTIWNDQNVDGVRNDEPGIANANIDLWDSTHQVVTSTTSDASGRYQFVSLTSGSYFLRFTEPHGMIFSAVDKDPALPLSLDDGPLWLRAGPIDILTNTSMITVHAGYYFPVHLQVTVSADKRVVVPSQRENITYTISVVNMEPGAAYQVRLLTAPPDHTVARLTQSVPAWECESLLHGPCVLEIDTLEAGVSYSKDFVVTVDSQLPSTVTRLDFLANAYAEYPPSLPCGCDPVVHSISVVTSEQWELPHSYSSYLPVWY